MTEKQRELMELLTRFEALMYRDLMCRRRQHGPFIDPHRGQGRIMSILNLKTEIPQKELGYLLDMSKQALAELLSKLEAADYIVRTPSEEDARAMVVRLTEKGRQAADEMEPDGESGESVFDCLNSAEQETLAEYLRRMTSALESCAAEDDPRRRWGRHGRYADGFDRGGFGGRGGRRAPADSAGHGHCRRRV